MVKRKYFIIFIFIFASLMFSSCGLFGSKPSVNIPNVNVPSNEEIEKMKEDIKKEANEMAGVDNEKRSRLLKEGKEAPAIIDRIEDTQVTVNKNPKIRMFLKVKPKNDDPFDAAVEMVVSRVNIPRTGDKVTVYFNANDKTDIIVK
jgi:hypothetical protein